MKEIKVSAAIIVDNDKIYCVQRGPGRSLENKWEFPGGKIESEESAREALAREIQEELLIKVAIDDEPFAESIYDYDFGRVHLHAFICRLVNGQPKLTEHIQYRWLAVDELASLDWAPADWPIVHQIQEDF
ncbi:(deoxy)nucleoside triphosphate pyrophosphohydrolase [Hutsoniella sourekii]|uniref:(deoxy)nucleoside triphosphate pyrophosphohydrolase n=1 Tax=Hutsoniella sourekii TaxID=87650 RepID=UPI0004B1FA54|nr:(deoxy)nucleoside triphosphate pyrophosphohydrolase [Hutsoniella sourekii]